MEGRTKTVAVVGDSAGIGAALRRNLLAAGHRVIGVSRTGVSEPAEGYLSLVFDAVAAPCDLAAFTESLDGLVYCPGTIALKPFRGIRREQWMHDLEVNLLGAVSALQANEPLLKRSPSASVVLFSTVAVGTGLSFHASIAAAKGAVEGLTRSLAAEWAPGIRVNAIAPSLTDTPLAAPLLGTDAKRAAAEERTPLRTVHRPEDIASLAAWLLSDAAVGMTGRILPVDAGLGAVR
jgi:NAD(P)-dependent dehydrogenase (short-subunit alcohol dehydrogenase family)